MEDLIIPGGEKTPAFNFNSKTGVLEIAGRSWPEHVLQTYQPAFDWVAEYMKVPAEETRVIMKMEYFNTSSSKVMLDLLKRINGLGNSGKKVVFEWYYEGDDPDLKETGLMIKGLLNAEFRLVEVDEI